MVLQQGSFLITQTSCDITTLLLRKYDTVEAFVQNVILELSG